MKALNPQDLKHPNSWKNVTVSQLEEMLAVHGFTQQRANGKSRIWVSTEFGAPEMLQYDVSGGQKKAPYLAVKEAGRLCQSVADRRASSNGHLDPPNLVVVELPSDLQNRFHASRQGSTVTLHYTDFPEFSIQFETGDAINPQTLSQFASQLTSTYQPVFDGLREIQDAYQISIEHNEEGISFVQNDLDLREICPRREQGFVYRLQTIMNHLHDAAQNIVDARGLRLLGLSDKRFVVDKEESDKVYIVTHPGDQNLCVRIPYYGPEFMIDQKGLAAIAELEGMNLVVGDQVHLKNDESTSNPTAEKASVVQNISAYWEGLAGLLTEQRIKRDWTISEFAVFIREELARQKPPVFTREEILQWEKYEDAPRTDKKFDVAVTLLIDQNPQVVDKQKARAEYKKACDAVIAWLDRNDGTSAPRQFGQLTTDYREQIDKHTGPFATAATEAAAKNIAMKPADATEAFIAKIEAERQLPLEGFVAAAVAVFERQATASGKAIPLLLDEKTKIDVANADLLAHPDRIPDSSANISYEEVFGGLNFRHLSERGWTEGRFAQLVREELERQQSPHLTEDHVTLWEKFLGVPETWPQLRALTTILVDNNSKISPDDKDAKRNEYFQAFATMKEALDNGVPFGSRPTQFGDLTTTYMRQIRKFADDIVVEMLSLMKQAAEVKLEDVTSQYIAEVKAERRKVPTEFLLAAIDVFERGATATTGKPMPLAALDEECYRQAYAGHYKGSAVHLSSNA